MTLIQLQYVLAVAEYKNFTLAAEKSFVTQPTLSMQIQKLEKELKVEIFDRSAQPIKLTQIGKKIVEQAKFVLSEVNRIPHLVLEEKELVEGVFTIGVIPTILPDLVPLFYKKFQQKYPKAHLVFKEIETNEIIAQLKDNSIDFGIAATPLNEEQIIEKPLYQEPFVAYIPKSHPLHKMSKINISDLNPEEVLVLKEGNCFRNNVLNLCEPKHSNVQKLKLESGNLKTLIRLSDEGFGYTILPKLYADDLPPMFQKNIRPFENPTPSRQISLIYHQSNLRETFEKGLVDTIQGVLRGKIFLEKIGTVTSPLLQVL